MSHDRGCFRCFEDHPYQHAKVCTIVDCPYKEGGEAPMDKLPTKKVNKRAKPVTPSIPRNKLEGSGVYHPKYDHRQPIIALGWDTIHNAIESLAYQVQNLRPTHIIAISRGGLIPGTMLSHKLNLPLSVVSAKSYEGTRRILQKPTAIEGIQTEWFRQHDHARTLVVDDVVDTGETYLAIKRELSDIPYVSIVNKFPELYKTYYFCHVPKNVWIKFPWELNNGR